MVTKDTKSAAPGKPAPGAAAAAPDSSKNTGGDLRVPLAEERAKNKVLAAELAQLKTSAAAPHQQEQPKNNINLTNSNNQIAMPEFKLTGDYPFMDGVEKTNIEAEINQHMQGFGQQMLQQVQQQMHDGFQGAESRAEVDRAMGQYTIFQDVDPRISDAAKNDLAQRMVAEPTRSLADITREAAEYWSQVKTTADNAATDAGAAPPATDAGAVAGATDAGAAAGDAAAAGAVQPLPSGGAGGDLGHMHEEPTVHGTFNEAAAAAAKTAEKWEGEQNAKGAPVQ